MHYIDHNNSVITRYLNGSKFYLNIKGTKILSNNFVETISNILLWQSITHSLSDSNYVHMIPEYKLEPMNVKSIESFKASGSVI